MPQPVSLPNPIQQKADTDNCLEKTEDEDDDKHDYEYIDEDELDSIREKFQRQNIHNLASPVMHMSNLQ